MEPIFSNTFFLLKLIFQSAQLLCFCSYCGTIVLSNDAKHKSVLQEHTPGAHLTLEEKFEGKASRMYTVWLMGS